MNTLPVTIEHETQACVEALEPVALGDIGDEIKKSISRGKSRGMQALEEFRKAGELLRHAKSQMPHGQWRLWLRDKAGLDDRTAQRYMQLAEHWDTFRARVKPATVSQLSLRSALQRIAESRPRAASTPRLTATDVVEAESLQPLVTESEFELILEHVPVDSEAHSILMRIRAELLRA